MDRYAKSYSGGQRDVTEPEGCIYSDPAADLLIRSFCPSWTGTPGSRSDWFHIGSSSRLAIQDLSA